MASKTVRNASIIAMATAAVAGSIVPANAFAIAAPVEAATAFSAPSITNYTSYNNQEVISGYTYTYEAPVEAPAAEIANVEGTRATVLAAAQNGLGGSYVWGGKTFKTWDCSGFVSWVYAQAGINLTAYTYTMATELVPTSTPQPGDIVFTNGYAHVGIYVGNGKMISALNPSQGTLETSVDGGGFMPVDGYYTYAGL
ncbi:MULTISPECIES: C40 family peptidase [unclassified Rothia (in: high G+C Gram-positive bacteria)]|uniref:C40 family peptidase n=1 Tax=unclassified Rothia (in: high G+C Gram-positive bacteria) TaxID=2689056 RepID=UPI0019571394|nr:MULTISPECIES: C40 family peptidase [unclassified Rothia (in: high G+C Gram-positive bacteria)]MBM7052028.1 C40 family peptidase [Rothia sp. ZJ1223]QRZ61914.1 C40 family peptidase [Rothia sp. ZJ932]